MKTLRLGFALVCLTLLPINANAFLVEVDWQTSGDNLITRDTVSGLEWLDLTVTAGSSFNAVFAQLGSGGTYEGWTYANEAQINSYFDNAGGVGIYSGLAHAHQVVFDSGIQEKWGVTEEIVNVSKTSIFLYDRTDINGDIFRGLMFNDLLPEDWTITTSHDKVLSSAGNPLAGSALVRSISTAAVPVPAAVWLFGSGFLSLIGMARRINGVRINGVSMGSDSIDFQYRW